jgi:hypothetical protein
MTQFNWTAEICDQIAAMWLKGLSAGKIAADIGTSRNATIGKLRRLGAIRGDAGRQEPAHLAASNKGRKRIETTVKPPQPPKPEPVPASFIQRDFSPRGHCRWIDGEVGKEWGCCDARAMPGRSWCGPHARLVHAGSRKPVEAVT